MRVFRAAALVAGLAAAGGAAAQAEPRGDADRLNSRGVALLAEGRLREAIEALRDAVARAPEETVYRRNLAIAWCHLAAEDLRAHRLPAAARALAEAVALEVESPVIDFHRGLLAFRRGEYEAAREHLGRAVAADESHREAWRLLGHACYRLDDLAATADAFGRVLRLRPDDELAGLLSRVRAEARMHDLADGGGSRRFRLRIDSALPAAQSIAERVMRHLDDAHAKVVADLGFQPRERTTVVLYTARTFKRVTGMHHWVAGTFDGARIRISVGAFDRHEEEIRRTLIHEYAHLVVLRMTAGVPVPAWLNEGYARYAEGIPCSAMDATLARLGGAVALFPLEKLREPFVRFRNTIDAERAYAQSGSFVHYLVRTRGARALGRVFARLAKDGEESFDEAFEAAFGVGVGTAVERWRAGIP